MTITRMSFSPQTQRTELSIGFTGGGRLQLDYIGPKAPAIATMFEVGEEATLEVKDGRLVLEPGKDNRSDRLDTPSEIGAGGMASGLGLPDEAGG